MSVLYTKLLKIQESLKALKSDKKGNGYEYLTGKKLLNYLKPMMCEHGIILKQEIVSIDNQRMDYLVLLEKNQTTKEWTGKPKSEILSKVMMQFTWIDCETGEKDVNSFGANGQNDWDKGVGSALTYGERYFLMKYFHLETDEDDIDNPERKKEESKPKEVAKPKTDIEKITEKCTVEQLEKITKKYNKDCLNSLTEKEIKEVILALKIK